MRSAKSILAWFAAPGTALHEKLAATALMSRLTPVDALRGFVMIIMALDHTREFFHVDAGLFQPDDLTRTTAMLFFTRWITHICAPAFMFLAGVGAYLRLARTRDRFRLSRFLWSRGLWLVLLELTVLRLAMNFSLTRGIVLLTVLWALGWSMMALGFLVRLPVRILAFLSVSIIVLHNLTDPVNASQLGSAGWIWYILHQPGIFHVGNVPVLAAYPLIPWAFVMAAGYCFGAVVVLDPPRRRAAMIRIGLAVSLAFIVIRWINAYGDPLPWAAQPSGMVFLSFLKCTKYPPSLDFLLMTLGPAILLLAWFDRFSLAKTNPLIVFGRVPLFYFLLHLFIIHGLTIPFALVRYGHAGFLFGPLPSAGGSAELFPPHYGYSLWTVYLVWIGVVVMTYPLCSWFARLKERKRSPWLSYL